MSDIDAKIEAMRNWLADEQNKNAIEDIVSGRAAIVPVGSDGYIRYGVAEAGDEVSIYAGYIRLDVRRDA